MEPLQTQILTLSHKLDALCQVIEQLDSKVAQAFSECSLANTQAKNNYGENSDVSRYQLKKHINLNPELEHKDVLTDGITLDMNRQGGDNNLTPEIQIQRLTAQLTAAYNRIAALEEQLMKVRIH
ncbi:hypothetical protein PN465_05235 [Nodularia spumigena CS-584]|jgi:hypothetical protein|uniref:Uncharacterized protein n=2 Tax=Nodularia spumigena TaxID=70799 RepID=A0A166JHR9_NODSP|nr:MULTISPECIES: hypothetical protein [Cyanophyceae]MDB9354913.1 hypothetical protein [Nodularia spumigena CS-587/03]AHJ29277.1 Signal transduction histidine kinase [Nodularia spumigena CCY9414]EAW43875.1 hypothetical protein N9414_13505 [Nodularia spumigena CCY9414]KZL49736.1 hypothetical protein A2T98_11200 [Nodularia spumigena CENA596]MDB9305592.1 hypothetical protein [Nodularia spumigena CS-591/12]